jgi:hypothetical protein
MCIIVICDALVSLFGVIGTDPKLSDGSVYYLYLKEKRGGSLREERDRDRDREH